MPDQLQNAPTPQARSRFAGKLLGGTGLLLTLPGFLLAAISFAALGNQMEPGRAVNPNAILFFIIGLGLFGGGIWMAIAADRMSKR